MFKSFIPSVLNQQCLCKTKISNLNYSNRTKDLNGTYQNAIYFLFSLLLLHASTAKMLSTSFVLAI